MDMMDYSGETPLPPPAVQGADCNGAEAAAAAPTTKVADAPEGGWHMAGGGCVVLGCVRMVQNPKGSRKTPKVAGKQTLKKAHCTHAAAAAATGTPDIWGAGIILHHIMKEGLKGDRPSQRALAATCKGIHSAAMACLELSAADISWYYSAESAVVGEKERLAKGVPWERLKHGSNSRLRTLHASPLHESRDEGLFVNVTPGIASLLQHLTYLDIDLVDQRVELEAIPATCPRLEHLHLTFRDSRGYFIMMHPLAGLGRLESLSIIIPDSCRFLLRGLQEMASGMPHLHSVRTNSPMVRNLKAIFPALTSLEIGLPPSVHDVVNYYLSALTLSLGCYKHAPSVRVVVDASVVMPVSPLIHWAIQYVVR